MRCIPAGTTPLDTYGGSEARLELLEERLAGLPIFLTLRALLLDGSSQISGDVDET